MQDLNYVALIVAVLGAGGIGAAIREIVAVITLARAGVSGKEQKRKEDLVAQRDRAVAEADAADARADAEAARRRLLQETLSRERRRLIELGHEPGPWPDIDETTQPGRPSS
jgi:hypothetical protein